MSDASHELKTPLAGIRLLSDSILQTENMDAQTVREFVGDIEQESERLARITENLLRLTRLDSGMLPEAQRVDLSSVMARVVRMLRLVAEKSRSTSPMKFAARDRPLRARMKFTKSSTT